MIILGQISLNTKSLLNAEAIIAKGTDMISIPLYNLGYETDIHYMTIPKDIDFQTVLTPMKEKHQMP